MPISICKVEPSFDAPTVRVYPLGGRRWTVCRVTAGGGVRLAGDHRLKRDAMRRVRGLLADTANVEAVLIDGRGDGRSTLYRRAALQVPPDHAP